LQSTASVGEVPYAWSIESDALVWGANATAVLKFADPASLQFATPMPRKMESVAASTGAIPISARQAKRAS